MSLLDNVRQSLEGAASSALEVGQNLGAQAQAQVNIKKLQIEHAKKLHQLGIKTYDWHKGGTMSTAGTIPREIHDLCHALDDLNLQIAEQQQKIETARLEAEARSARANQSPATPPGPATAAASGSAVTPGTGTASPPTATVAIPLPAPSTANTGAPPNITQKLGDDNNGNLNP